MKTIKNELIFQDNMPEFKQVYLDRYKKLLGDELDIFLKAIVTPLPKAFKINTLKVKKEYMLKRLKDQGWEIEQVPFYENGFYFTGKRDFVVGNTLEHFLGYIYVQETASMIPPVVLDPKPGELILDMAAAPGSKTTQMAQMMQNKGAIIANEKTINRIRSLRINLQRSGITNTVVTHMDGRAFRQIEGLQFDKILLDVPCTGTGTIMKSPHTIKMWSEKSNEMMSNLQKQLIQSAVNVLKPGGILVYSTCSLEPEENEINVDYMIEKMGLEIKDIKLKDFKTRPGITEWGKKKLNKDVAKSIRVYPQDNNSGGFFVAKMVKKE